MKGEKSYGLSEMSVKPPLLTVIIFPDAGRYVAKCIELDLTTEMDTSEGAVGAMVEMLREYAEDYRGREDVFARSSNRAHHKPYIDVLLECKTDWDIQELLEIRYGRLHIQPISAGVV